jgi:hypothetical protein
MPLTAAGLRCHGHRKSDALRPSSSGTSPEDGNLTSKSETAPFVILNAVRLSSTRVRSKLRRSNAETSARVGWAAENGSPRRPQRPRRAVKQDLQHCWSRRIASAGSPPEAVRLSNGVESIVRFAAHLQMLPTCKCNAGAHAFRTRMSHGRERRTSRTPG